MAAVAAWLINSHGRRIVKKFSLIFFFILLLTPLVYGQHSQSKSEAGTILVNEHQEVDHSQNEGVLSNDVELKIQSALTAATQEKEAEKYWLNTSSMVRHNSSCRYYGNTKNGRYTTKKEGRACKICGG